MFDWLFGPKQAETVLTIGDHVWDYGVLLQLTTSEETLTLIDQLSQELQRVEDVLKNTLPVEVDKKRLCNANIYDLQTKLYQVEMAQKGFPVFLKWEILELRHMEKIAGQYGSTAVPTFMVLDMNQEIKEMTIEVAWDAGLADHLCVKVSPQLPEEVVAPYRYLAHLLGNGATIKASFEGIIPDEVAEKVRNINKGGLFDQILMIAQVPKWNVVIREDPLVVGYKHNRLWLITQFDLQPSETWAINNLISVF